MDIGKGIIGTRMNLFLSQSKLFCSLMGNFLIRSRGKPSLIATDFDGCLTDDKVYVNDEGAEFVQVTRRDGLGAQRLRDLNVGIVILSSERNNVVSARARKMGVDVVQNVANKVEALKDFVDKHSILWSDTWFVGNGVNDRDLAENASFVLCPADSALEIRKISDVILPIKGGEGILNYIAHIIETLEPKAQKSELR